MARTTDRTARREALVDAAAALFSQRGVACTAVSDIVKAAGVAQGTFYLYFATKDDVLLAVVERTADSLLDAMASAAAGPELTAVERFRALSTALARIDAEADDGLVDLLHRRENRELHDRMAEHLLPRFVPLVVSIVEQGLAEGAFDVADATAAAWFVVGGLSSIELSGTAPAEQPAALEAASELALRALGYAGGGASR